MKPELLPPSLIDGEALSLPAYQTPEGAMIHVDAVYLEGQGWCISTVRVEHERQDTAEVSFKPMLMVNAYAPESRFAAGMGLLIYYRAHVEKRDDEPPGTFPVPAR